MKTSVFTLLLMALSTTSAYAIKPYHMRFINNTTETRMAILKGVNGDEVSIGPEIKKNGGTAKEVFYPNDTSHHVGLYNRTSGAYTECRNIIIERQKYKNDTIVISFQNFTPAGKLTCTCTGSSCTTE